MAELCLLICLLSLRNCLYVKMTINMCTRVLGHFSRARLCMTLWTVACQAPLSMGILQARTLALVAMPSSRGSS